MKGITGHVYFITGKAGAGKTTYAVKLAEEKNAVLLDGDEMRRIYLTGFTDRERMMHIMRMAHLAENLAFQGFNVIIAAIMPRKVWREKARSLIPNSSLIYIPGGTLWFGTEYEIPDESEGVLVYNRDAQEKEAISA